jgi:hypothetical protein
MPKQKDLKRLVRDRMDRTGESYTAARKHIVRANDDRRDFAELAGMRDEAVKAKTDRDWRGWVAVLDAAGSTSKTHKEIARWLRDAHGVAPWWCQTITVGYERIRGLRDKGQRRGGGYDVNKSKTLPVPIDVLYDAFGCKRRGQWLGDVTCRIRTATREKSMRFDWGDDTRLDVYFWPKGPGKSQVQLQHRGFADKASADRAREQWTERLAALARLLGGA